MNILTRFQEEAFINTIVNVGIRWFVDVGKILWHDLVEEELTNGGYHNLLALFIGKRLVRE